MPNGEQGSRRVWIDVGALFGADGPARLAELPEYERRVEELAGRGNEVVLTGRGPIWLYLRLAHRLHGVAGKLLYDSPALSPGEPVVIFDHTAR